MCIRDRMKTTKTVSELRTLLSRVKGPIGLVPTMGAIHEGHVALLKKARTDCSTVVASIFINPNQFNRKEDYFNYGGGSEFCGHPYEVQLSRIQNGLNKFEKENIKINIYYL